MCYSHIRKGFYIFSYRPLEHWERKLLIENSYHNTNHILSTKVLPIQVAQRRYDSILANKEFNPIYVKNWYTYECNKEIYQIYPREFKWLDIQIPNKITHTTYIPELINTGDTLVFETEDKVKHLN